MSEAVGMSFYLRLLLICSVFIYTLAAKDTLNKDTKGLRVVTVATEVTDGFARFSRSVKKYGLKMEVLGMGEKWKGGDMAYSTGGGQKIILFREMMEKVKDNKELIIMFTDSYDVIVTAGEEEIMKAFKKFDAKVVFSSEGFCWPDAALADSYPPVKLNEKRYLNSGGIIGYAPQIYKILSSSEVKDNDDDQLFYTKIFLDETMRKKLGIKLDTRGELFQNLHGALDEVQLKFKGASSYLYNSKTGNQPIVIHGNGPIKTQFNTLGNYLGDSWTATMGCQACKEDTISLEGVSDDDMPEVFLALFLAHPLPFAEEFFEAVAALDYPKGRMDLFIHYHEFHEKDVTRFSEKYGMEYNSARMYGPDKALNEWTGRNQALEDCAKEECQYLFVVDGEVQIEDPNLLRHLIQTNRSVIGPLTVRPGKLWSNFWGALSKEGFYKRSDDYGDIVESKKKGIWNIPYMTHAMLFHGFRVKQLQGAYVQGDLDQDMAMSYALREKGIFMYIDNQKYYGHLVNSDRYETTHLHNDMYTIFDNPMDWEKKYIHANYRNQLAEGFVFEQPCPDVFWLSMVTVRFCTQLIEEMENYGEWSGGKNKPCPDVFWSPIFSVRFTEELIAEMENFGEWSGGKNTDPRISGGYENVPTVDIHMNQIGYEQHWLQFLKEYVAPINQKIYTGYWTESRAIMNFVVRYKPGEQDRLRPHHDSSTYTINVALNRPNLDYQGGGVRFLRYNCTVVDLRQGWMLMHPGRLTHLHEGLPTTGGTRYIMISFIDP